MLTICDIVERWLAEQPYSSILGVEKCQGTKGHQVLILHRKTPIGGRGGYLLSFNSEGDIWRGPAYIGEISEVLHPSDPEFLDKLGSLIRFAFARTPQ